MERLSPENAPSPAEIDEERSSPEDPNAKQVDVHKHSQFRRFLVESVVLAVAVAAWVLYDYYMAAVSMKYAFKDPRIYVYVIGVQLVVTLIFYGTSFEVTPLYWVRLFGKTFAKSVNSITRFNDHKATPVQGEIPEESADQVNQILSKLGYSAELLAARMERRLNTYLILGIAVGGVGLGVWAYANQIPTSITNAPGSIWEALLFRTLPRLTILIFIEVLAGFFLRQYRIGVEDFKYFLHLKRQTDMNRLSYAMIVALNDDVLKAKFFDALLAQNASGRADDTAKVMELSENPTAKLVEALSGTLSDAVKTLAAAAAAGKGK